MSTEKTNPLSGQERNVWNEKHQTDSLETALSQFSSTKKPLHAVKTTVSSMQWTSKSFIALSKIMIAHNRAKN